MIQQRLLEAREALPWVNRDSDSADCRMPATLAHGGGLPRRSCLAREAIPARSGCILLLLLLQSEVSEQEQEQEQERDAAIGRRARAFSATVLLSCFLCLLRLPGEESPVASAAGLGATVEKLIDIPELAKVRVGVQVVRLGDGEVVCAREADQLFVVASNNKLIVSAAALHVLGKDFRFKTLVWTDGRLSDDGTLNGNIIVRGGGDPNLSGRFHDRATSLFEDWTEELRKKGCRRIKGAILADDSAFDREWTNPDWPKDQLTHWYCAPSSALSFNDNCIDVTVRPGRTVGAALVVVTSPKTSYVKLKVTGKTGGAKTRSAVWFSRRPGSNSLTIGGKHPFGGAAYTNFATVHNPALGAVHVLREVLIAGGIEVTGEADVWDGPALDPKKGGRLIAAPSSALLGTLQVMNKRSQNFYAEQVLKALGLEAGGKGTTKNGLDAVAGVLAQAGVPTGEYHMVDGSGMSRGNRFSPSQVVKVLSWMHAGDYGETFRSTLAVGGEDGTLADRFTSPGLKGRVLAKSGYLRGASALSGYLVSKTGSDYAFSILMNGFKGTNRRMKKIQEAICEAIYLLPAEETPHED